MLSGVGGTGGSAHIDDRPLRVLLVEDDDGDALLVEEMLADSPARVTLSRATSLAEATRGTVDADCVLLDLQLPDAAGLDGLGRLRRHAPSTAVLVLTGQRDEHTGVAAVGSGAQDYLVKDQVDGPLLVKALRYAWERKRLELLEQQVFEQELVAGENDRLERGLLPTPLLNDPELRFASRYRPGRVGSRLGGDFYDAVELPDGSVQLVVGDICGHGPYEAALGVALRIAWRSLVLAGLDVGDVLGTVERMLVYERVEPVFATLCTISVAPDRRSLRMWLAGHPPPLLVTEHGGGLLPGDDVGVPLGVLPKGSWAPRRVELDRGWSLMLYTDGIFEGRVHRGPERLGLEGMVDLLLGVIGDVRSHWRADREGVIDELISAAERLNGGPLDDDVAIALLTDHPAGRE